MLLTFFLFYCILFGVILDYYWDDIPLNDNFTLEDRSDGLTYIIPNMET